MKFPRRRFLHWTAGAAALSIAPRIARGQTYPTRPVHLIVGAGPGSAPDVNARLLSEELSERLGQPLVVDDRPGAGTNIATEAVVRAPPDGYTLLLVTLANAVNASLYTNLDFNFLHDIEPIASISREPLAMVVGPSFLTKTVPEFIAYAKANPGKLIMASPGIGTSPHMAGELFSFMVGIDLVHVPYRSSAPAMIDLIADRVQVMFVPLPASIDYIRAGKLRALAVTTAARSNALPEIPALAEFVPGYEAGTFYGIGAPNNTPAEIVNRLNQAINACLSDPKLKARFDTLGSVVIAGSPAEFGQMLAVETEKWSKIVKTAGIKPY